MVFKEPFAGPGEVAQLVEHLLYKQEDLSLGLQHPYKKLGAVTCSCNPVAGNMKAGNPLSSLANPSS